MCVDVVVRSCGCGEVGVWRWVCGGGCVEVVWGCGCGEVCVVRCVWGGGVGVGS